MEFLIWIVVSGFAGFVASKLINKSGSGLLMDIVLGIVGGFVGGYIVSRVPALSNLAVGVNPIVVEIVVAILGAMLIIFLYDLLFRRRA